MASEKHHAPYDILQLPTYAPQLEHAHSGHRKSAYAKLATAVVLSLAFLALTQSAVRERLLARVFLESSSPSALAPPLGFPEKIQRRWGQYSPYYPAGEYVPPPSGCEITQVNILQRHGARYPNGDDDYALSVKHLRHAKEYRDSELFFLKDYRYELKADVLVPYGAEQSFESGESAYKRYGHLVNEGNTPFVRASSKPRVVSSAGNWTVGFAAASHHHYNPPLALILSESHNNTLNQKCPAASDGLDEAHKWLRVFAPPIVARLQKAAKGSKVAEEDIHSLMTLCPFETLARERPSPFCGLFSDEEFRALEYYGDVEKYYKTGYGNPLGPAQGIGYVNELLARLMGRPPTWDRTTHDPTQPFPLGRGMYVDFTHENLMIAVYSAMGLYNVSEPLDPKHMPARPDEVTSGGKGRRGGDEHEDGDEGWDWTASRMVPFSARMVVERLSCSFEDPDGGDDDPEADGEYVRIFVNDELQPLEFCRFDEDDSEMEELRAWRKRGGLCLLENFVESQVYARGNGGGDFEKCWQ